MKLSFTVVMALFAASAWAQTYPWLYQPLGQVKDFLQLSESQLQTILTNNGDYNRWSAEKQTRIRQVRTELAIETAKEPLDPNALGIRYAEVETICREMKDRANEYRTLNIGVLSPDQKAKLKVLEDALKLASVISEAQNGNLIGGLTSPPNAFTSTSLGIGGSLIGSSLIGSIIGPTNGCSSPLPTSIIRTGDFSSTSGNIIPRSQISGAVPNAEGADQSSYRLFDPTMKRPVNRWFDTTEFVTPGK